MPPVYAYRVSPQKPLNFEEMLVDSFAGGGGASMGIELALGRQVDIAINHDLDAIRMHETNHPHTTHYCESVWEVDPKIACQGRSVGLAWFSPDCKHHSKARGGKPVEKNIRGLAWIVRRWVATVRPRVIILENVEEFKDWGPLVIGEDGGRYPCKKRKGRTFKKFVKMMQSYGYAVEWNELRACDYGAPTIRKRLFLVARCDSAPIVWPSPTHGNPASIEVKSGRLLPWRSAAECVDWSVPAISVFERKRTLAEATCRRIAKGVDRYVLRSESPYLVDLAEGKPVSKSSINPVGPGETAGVLSAGFLAKDYTGVVGSSLNDPMATVTAVDHHSLVAANLVHLGHGEGKGGGKRFSHGVRSINDPLNTVTASGATAGLVISKIVPIHAAVQSQEDLSFILLKYPNASKVRSFLKQYSGPQVSGFSLVNDHYSLEPNPDALVKVQIADVFYVIVDIGMRMLTPRELFTAQGFPANYVIDSDGKGKPFSKTVQVARCGNSVSPVMAEALVSANYHAQSLRKTA